MGFDVAPIGTPGFDPAPSRTPRDARADASVDTVELGAHASGEIPSSPPPEVLDAIDAAGRVARELHAQGRELHFVPPDEGTDDRVRIEVRDLDGNVLRTIPASELLDVATGAPLE
jgi:hypothetical protein